MSWWMVAVSASSAQAGISVKTGILKASTHKLAEAFCHFIKYRRPWIHGQARDDTRWSSCDA